MQVLDSNAWNPGRATGDARRAHASSVDVSAPLTEVLTTAVARALDSTDRLAVETSDRLGPALLHVLVAQARQDSGDDIHAFAAAPSEEVTAVPHRTRSAAAEPWTETDSASTGRSVQGSGAGVLWPGWEVRQMRTLVLLAPPRLLRDKGADLARRESHAESVAGRQLGRAALMHADLLFEAQTRGFDVFLCGDLPAATEHPRDVAAGSGDGPEDFADQLKSLGNGLGIDVRFPFHSPEVVHCLSKATPAQRIGLLVAVASTWLPTRILRPAPCHETSWT